MIQIFTREKQQKNKIRKLNKLNQKLRKNKQQKMEIKAVEMGREEGMTNKTKKIIQITTTKTNPNQSKDKAGGMRKSHK